MEECKKIVVICGPTASGKTGLSIELAQKFNGEIISADSMQVYKNLDVGTAKATEHEQSLVRHHLIDFLNPEDNYNVEIFTRLAKEKIDDLTNRGKLPFIVGGTGLYIESLLNGIKFTQQADTNIIKNQLKQLLKDRGNEFLYDELLKIDPDYAKNVHPNNTVRVMRAIEIYKATGVIMSKQIANSKPSKKPYNSLVFALNFCDREKLYGNINKRVDIMLSQGIEKEAQYVYNNKQAFTNSAAAIGYKEFFPYFENTQTIEECTEKLKQSSRNYAKRQITWFKRMQDINWLYIDSDDNYTENAISLTDKFLGEE